MRFRSRNRRCPLCLGHIKSDTRRRQVTGFGLSPDQSALPLVALQLKLACFRKSHSLSTCTLTCILGLGFNGPIKEPDMGGIASG